MTMTEPTSPKAPRAKRFAREPKTDVKSSPAAERLAGADTASPPEPPAARKPGKIDAVIALLGREDGATLAEITDATGWLPHSARAALTGLRKKGHVLEKTRRGDATCYVLKAGA